MDLYFSLTKLYICSTIISQFNPLVECLRRRSRTCEKSYKENLNKNSQMGLPSERTWNKFVSWTLFLKTQWCCNLGYALRLIQAIGQRRIVDYTCGSPFYCVGLVCATSEPSPFFHSHCSANNALRLMQKIIIRKNVLASWELGRPLRLEFASQVVTLLKLQLRTSSLPPLLYPLLSSFSSHQKTRNCPYLCLVPYIIA